VSEVIAHNANSSTVSNECLAGVTSNGTYGFVHRNGTNVLPQRSLDSPGTGRTCDILLDLERSSGSFSEGISSGRVPDLMTKSYHDHYHDTPWLDNRMRMLHMSREADWRNGAMLAAQVVTCVNLYTVSQKICPHFTSGISLSNKQDIVLLGVKGTDM